MRPILSRLLIGTAFGLLFAATPAARAQDVPDGVEVQPRGPVHEAFANPVEGTPQPGRVIDRHPPEPIEEQPPDQKPEGDNVQWIPGYWAWDDGRSDFLWISGFWRVPPPGRVWVPGSWRQAAGGWQWTPGFWSGAEQQQLEYLPPPPETLEAGPTIPAPADDHVYVPGTWVYSTVNYRYAWRPGTWVVHRPGWVWAPACYRWTPVGYVFVDGYWDYPLAGRGCLFSPVWIDRRVCYRPNWYYRPTYVIQDTSLYGAMFVRPGCSHYYFGNYFEARYTALGYRSWFSVSFGRGFAYDPLFSYYRVQYRSDPYWAPGLREVYAARFAGDLPRPPVRVVNNTTVVNNFNVNSPTIVNRYTNINRSTNITNITNVNNTVVNINNINNTNVNNANTNTNVNNAVNRPAGMRFQRVDPAQREQFVKAGQEYRTAAKDRVQVESQLRTRGVPTKSGDAPVAATVPTFKPTVGATGAGANPNPRLTPPPPAVVTRPNPGTAGTPNAIRPRPGTDTPANPGRPGRPVTPTNPADATKPTRPVNPAVDGNRPKPPVNPPTNPTRPNEPVRPTGTPKPPVTGPANPTGTPRPPVTPPANPAGTPRPPVTGPTGTPKPPLTPPANPARPTTPVRPPVNAPTNPMRPTEPVKPPTNPRPPETSPLDRLNAPSRSSNPPVAGPRLNPPNIPAPSNPAPRTQPPAGSPPRNLTPPGNPMPGGGAPRGFSAPRSQPPAIAPTTPRPDRPVDDPAPRMSGGPRPSYSPPPAAPSAPRTFDSPRPQPPVSNPPPRMTDPGRPARQGGSAPTGNPQPPAEKNKKDRNR